MTSTKAFPGFAPGENRTLLAEISKWRKATGWAFSPERGWINAAFSNAATLAVDYDNEHYGFAIVRKDDRAGTWDRNPDFYPAANVRQAVDMLAVIGILPVVFSSAYRQGRSDAAFIGNVDTNPDRMCRRCGATSGLRLLPGNPLVVAPGEWECVGGCPTEQSGR